MCVIIIGGSGVRPSRKTLTACHEANRDGAGVAWVHTNGRVRFVKGLDARGVHEVLTRIVPKEADYVVHFRFATAGGALPVLTHPFVVSDDSDLRLEGEVDRVLFHNGHESRFEELMKQMREKTGRCLEGPVSDSRVVARLAHLAGLDILDKMSGKYVVLGGKGIETMSPPLGLVLTGQTGYGAGTGWVMHEGLTFSNLHWKVRTWSVATQPAPRSKDADTQVSFRGCRPDTTLRSAQLELGYRTDEVSVARFTRAEIDDLEARDRWEAARADAQRAAEYEAVLDRPGRDVPAAPAVGKKAKRKAKLLREAVKRAHRVGRSIAKMAKDDGPFVYVPPSCKRDMSVVPADPKNPRNLRQDK